MASESQELEILLKHFGGRNILKADMTFISPHMGKAGFGNYDLDFYKIVCILQ